MVFKCAFSRDVITIIQNKKSTVDHDVFVVINAENLKKNPIDYVSNFKCSSNNHG